MNTRHPSLPCPKMMPVWLNLFAITIPFNTTIPYNTILLDIISCKYLLYHIFYLYHPMTALLKVKKRSLVLLPNGTKRKLPFLVRKNGKLTPSPRGIHPGVGVAICEAKPLKWHILTRQGASASEGFSGWKVATWRILCPVWTLRRCPKNSFLRTTKIKD